MPKRMPNAAEIQFKEGFVKRYTELTDWETFKEYCTSFPRRSIRVNTLKISVKELKKRLENLRWTLETIPWCKEGFWVEHAEGRRDIGNTIEHGLGYYYVQEAASMIPPLCLDVKPGNHVLDLCAAPGSKTTQLAMYMENNGLIVANDYRGERLAPLGINLNRCGVTNNIITLMLGQRWKAVHERFDRILVDAPCSGTGTVRKSIKTLRIWNPNMVRKLAETQKQLLETGYGLLKAGGVLVYSTCSLEPEENEAVVDWLLEKHPDATVEKVSLKGLTRSQPVLSFEGKKYDARIKEAVRIWPQDNDTEGFFVCKILKIK